MDCLSMSGPAVGLGFRHIVSWFHDRRDEAARAYLSAVASGPQTIPYNHWRRAYRPPPSSSIAMLYGRPLPMTHPRHWVPLFDLLFGTTGLHSHSFALVASCLASLLRTNCSVLSLPCATVTPCIHH